MRRYGLLAMMACVLIAADGPGPNDGKDLGLIQGRWELVMQDGKPISPSPNVAFDGNALTWYTPTGKTHKTCSFDLDPRKNPKTLDEAPEGRHREVHYVYTFDDENTLKLGFNGPGGARPASFSQARTILIFKRK